MQGGVLLFNGCPSLASFRNPNSNTKQISYAPHDAVSSTPVFGRRKSCFVPKSEKKASMSETTTYDVLKFEKKASMSGITTFDVKKRFGEVYELLKSELLNETIFEWTDHSRQWLEQMMDYNVIPGKLFRGLSVIDGYMSLKEGKDLTEDELLLACILGWCVEWFQASILVHDDIMDNSESRRGEPCWYRLPKVGKSIAINDGNILVQQVPRILKKHFADKPYYVDLLNLFNEVEYQTYLGQMIDVITTIEGEKDLLKYSLTLHHRIAVYKTSYYSFYLPVACALVLAGDNLENLANTKGILHDMGIYFQVVNDYQDCYGDLKKTGKVGTDIQDFKFSWLILQALELCSEEQKKTLLESYGKSDAVNVAKVKAIYNEIDLPSVFADYERKNYEKLRTSIKAHPCKAVQAVGARYLGGLSQWL